MKSISRIFKGLVNKIKNYGKWKKTLLIFAILLGIIIFTNNNAPIQEGFIQREKFLFKQGPDVFDNFYIDLYDDVVYEKIKNNYEIGEIINKTSPTENDIILDIGSGTGHLVNSLSKQNCNVIGIDSSPIMVNKAKTNFPNNDYRQMDVMQGMNFSPNTFNTITCLNFTIYYLQNKNLFFENCYNWLVPGGKLIVHLIDRKNFSKEKKITDLDHFQYSSYVDLQRNDLATYNEIFKDENTGKVRRNEHKLFMPTQKNILSTAKDVGFILLAKTNMATCNQQYQYIYTLQKPTS
jgi:SAM-dependent methyltransferase